MNCDHGISLARYCPDCEWLLLDDCTDDPGQHPHQAALALLILALAVGAILIVRFHR